MPCPLGVRVREIGRNRRRAFWLFDREAKAKEGGRDEIEKGKRKGGGGGTLEILN